jgi:hypothetical protein
LSLVQSCCLFRVVTCSESELPLVQSCCLFRVRVATGSELLLVQSYHFFASFNSLIWTKPKFNRNLCSSNVLRTLSNKNHWKVATLMMLISCLKFLNGNFFNREFSNLQNLFQHLIFQPFSIVKFLAVFRTKFSSQSPTAILIYWLPKLSLRFRVIKLDFY